MAENHGNSKNDKNNISTPKAEKNLNPNSAFDLVKSKIFEMYKIYSKNKTKKDD